MDSIAHAPISMRHMNMGAPSHPATQPPSHPPTHRPIPTPSPPSSRLTVDVELDAGEVVDLVLPALLGLNLPGRHEPAAGFSGGCRTGRCRCVRGRTGGGSLGCGGGFDGGCGGGLLCSGGGLPGSLFRGGLGAVAELSDLVLVDLERFGRSSYSGCAEAARQPGKWSATPGDKVVPMRCLMEDRRRSCLRASPHDRPGQCRPKISSGTVAHGRPTVCNAYVAENNKQKAELSGGGGFFYRRGLRLLRPQPGRRCRAPQRGTMR